MMKTILLLLIGLLLPQIICTQEWKEIDGINSTTYFKEIEFFNIEKGMSIQNYSVVFLRESSVSNWLSRAYITSNTLNALEPSPTGEYLLVGDNGTVAKSQIDRTFVNWFDIQIPSNNNLHNSTFSDAENVWIVGDSSTLLYSSDGADSFSTVTIPDLNAEYRDIAINGTVGIIVTSSDKTGISMDGGTNWQVGATLPSTDFDQVEYGRGQFWAFSAQNNSLFSSINGDIWELVDLPIGELNELEVRGDILYLVGDSGISYVSTSGNNWDIIPGTQNSIDLKSISCTDNGCFAGGTEGKVYFYCDSITVGGKIWREYNNNCRLDRHEKGFSNVSVSLLAPNGTEVKNTVSDEEGNYEFNTKPGTYSIRINSSLSDINSPLYSTKLCKPGSNPNDDFPNDQNGESRNGKISTVGSFDLFYGTEPGALGVVNKTIDFGFKFDCDVESNPYSAHECKDAIPICDLTLLEQGCYTMPSIIDNIGPSPICLVDTIFGANPDNMTWFAFIAGMNPGEYQIEIIFSGCQPGAPPSTSTVVQYGVHKDCTWEDPLICEIFCEVQESDIIIPSEDLIPGNSYLLWIDGCGGSYCAYDFNILGNFEPFKSPQPEKLLCDGEPGECEKICPGTIIEFEIIDTPNQSGVAIYPDLELELPEFGFSWTIKNEFGLDILTEKTATNKLSYTFDEIGYFEVCFTDLDYHCKDELIQEICKEIEVIIIEDEDFGVIKICEDELLAYTGPRSVNDEGLISDPNNDGIDGWQLLVPFMDGPVCGLVTTARGCVYQQKVEIKELFDSNIADVTHIICDESELPVVIFDQMIDYEVEGLFFEFDGESENGCDSLVNVNIYFVFIEGKIEEGGCDSSGVQLVFNPSLIKNAAGFPIDGVWTNSKGETIPDDMDGDPFTISIPSEPDLYNLTLIFDADGILSCSHDFSFTYDGQLTPIDLPVVTETIINRDINDSVIVCSDIAINVALMSGDTILKSIDNTTVHWSIDAGDSTSHIMTNETQLTILDYPTGTYEICFDSITHSCSSMVYDQICKTITINDGGNPPTITCAATISTISFTWTTDSTHAYYIITDASGNMDTITSNNYEVTGLNPGDVYDLILTTVYNNGCPNTTTVLSCQTLDCPIIDIILDAGGLQTICLQDSVNTVDINVTISSMPSGVGVFSGPGIIDATEGIFDANVAGEGVHQIIYTYTDQSCVYEASIQMTVIGSISASFTISDDTICLEDQVMVEFTGMASNSTAFVWTFGGATVLSGMGSGPYTLAYDTTGVFTIDLALEDTICGSASVSGNILVQDCTPMPNSCICPDLIDTTIVCPAIFDPVCGCDGVTYSNACEAQFFGGVMSWTAGPCNNTNMDTISVFCDDGNPMTQNDSINENCECVGEIINDVNDLINQITFFPNPTDGIIYAEGIRDEDITVVNTLGQLLKRTRMKGNKIDITDLPTGIYLIKVGSLGVKRVYKE